VTWFTVRRLATACAKATLIAFGTEAGMRLARKHIKLTPVEPGQKRSTKRKKRT
jgi:hypothetical protein